MQAFYYSDTWLNIRSRPIAIFSALFLLGGAVAIYQLLVLYGFDPDWSVQKALKWCQKKSWVYLDTTPFCALARLSGAALALALGVTSVTSKREMARSDESYGIMEQLLRVIIGVLAGGLAVLANKNLPKDNLNVFYALVCVLNFALVAFVIFAVPALSRGVFKTELPEESEKKSKKKPSTKKKAS